MTTQEALELASTIALVDELQKRFDHVVIHGVQIRPTPDVPHNQNAMWRFKGNAHFCQGLCADLSHRLEMKVLSSETSLPPEDL